MKTKILFVCHGNICRSPMAEYIMKDLVDKAGLTDEFEIASAATSTEELGNPVYPPARRKLAEHGINCKGHEAHQMTRQEYAYYDYIYCMDRYNVMNLGRMTGGDPDGKISMLLNHEVADPWYTGNFDATWRDCLEGCSNLLDRYQKFGSI